MAAQRTVLALFAKPMEMEQMVAGTLTRLAAKGFRVVSMTMTPGDCTSRDQPTDVISEIRQKESTASVSLIQGQFVCVNFRDGLICFDNETRKKVCDFVRRVAPYIVFTHPPGDPVPDHDTTSTLARDACIHANIRNYRSITERAVEGPTPYLYYVDTLEGLDLYGNPVPVDSYVDISQVFAVKQKMFACHESQQGWEDARWQVEDPLADMIRWSNARGAEVGVKQAEAFRQHRAVPFPRDNILDRLLGTLHAEAPPADAAPEGANPAKPGSLDDADAFT